MCQKEADVLEPVVRDLRAIIERARMNARLEERRKIAKVLRLSVTGPFGPEAIKALRAVARAIEEEEPTELAYRKRNSTTDAANDSLMSGKEDDTP